MLCSLCPCEATREAPGYRLWVCENCWQEAEGGWSRVHETVLFSRLAKEGLLVPDRNEANLLPRLYAPPADFAL